MASMLHRSRVGRITALSVGAVLTLAVSPITGPAMAFEHSPWSPVEGALEAIEEGRYEDIAAYFCEEQQPQILGLDFGSALVSDFSADASTDDLSSALGWKVDDFSASHVEATFPPPPVMTLRVSGSVHKVLDPENVFALFETFVAGGLDEPDAQSIVDSIGASLDMSRTDFSEELTVVQSEGEAFDHYLICSEFVALAAIAGLADAGVESVDDGE